MFFLLSFLIDCVEASCSLIGFVLVGRNVSILRFPDTRQYEKYFFFKSNPNVTAIYLNVIMKYRLCVTNRNFEKFLLIFEPTSNYKVALCYGLKSSEELES